MNCDDSGTSTVIQGEDRDLILRIVDKLTQIPFDLTQATAINARFAKADGTRLIKTVGNGVTIISAPAGKIDVFLSAAETALLVAREEQSFEVEIVVGTGLSSRITVVQFLKALTVRGRAV